MGCVNKTVTNVFTTYCSAFLQVYDVKQNVKLTL